MTDITERVCAELGITPSKSPTDGGDHVTRMLLSTTVEDAIEEIRASSVTKIYKVTLERLMKPHSVGEYTTVIKINCFF